MSHREKIRCKAIELHGEMIFDLKNYDLFQFSESDDTSITEFHSWSEKQKEVDHVETCSNRVAVKYKK